MAKVFFLSSLFMLVILLFLLVDLASVFEDFVEWVQELGAWGPIVAAVAWIPVCMLFVPGLILSLCSGFTFNFPAAFVSVSGSSCCVEPAADFDVF